MNRQERPMAKTPTSIGKYKIVSLVARGGMGAVYKAIHPTLKRYVILKRLTIRGSRDFTARFKREALIMMDFKNEHIVNVYDHFKEGSSYYIVSEFVDGLSLDKLIERASPLPNDVSLRIFLDCCRALQYAHERKVIHRDIKPANILISKKGEVKLVDFGIAAMADEEEEGLTREGTTLGTPSYMAPEQFEDSKSVDSRADIYSLGVMLYEMVTAEKPYPGSFSADSIAKIQKGKHTSARKLNRMVSPLVNGIIKRCMHVKPKRRFQDLRAVIIKIVGFLKRNNPGIIKQRLISFIREEPVRELPKRASPTLKIILVMGLLLLALLGASGYFIYKEGYLHEYLWPQSYGAFTVQAKVKKGFKMPEETFISATLFLDDGQTIPRVESVSIAFKENRQMETEKYFVLKSPKIYVLSGHYRIKVNLENELYWNTFFLSPRTLQRQKPSTEGSWIIEVTLEEIPPLPLAVLYTVTDQSTGEDITDSSILFLKKGDYWVKWDRHVARTLTTNRRYQFRFGKLGYLSRDYDLTVAPYQTLLNFEVSLIPEPATVEVVSNYDGLELLLNGSPYYLSGGQDRSYKKLQPTTAETQILELSPGEYELTVYRSPSLSKTVTLGLKSRSRREVRIQFDPAEKSLEVDLNR
jgi:serine/threonine protein kinase